MNITRKMLLVNNTTTYYCIFTSLSNYCIQIIVENNYYHISHIVRTLKQIDNVFNETQHSHTKGSLLLKT